MKLCCAIHIKKANLVHPLNYTSVLKGRASQSQVKVLQIHNLHKDS